MEIKEIFIPFGEFKTYCRIVNPKGKNRPLLMLHGGPGSSHNSFELFDELAKSGDRPLIMYDQIGCGLSSIPDVNPEIYCKETWLKELNNLIDFLNLESFHLIGHSWGGMLAILHCIESPDDRVKSLILSSTLSSAALWKIEAHNLAKKLSKADQEEIKKAEASNNYSSKGFELASAHYIELTVGPYKKDDPRIPECIRRKKIGGSVAYLTAWGPSEFAPSGNLKDYDVTNKLHLIKAPSLVIHGEFDESTPKQNQIIFSSLGGEKKLVEVPKARHMTYFDNPSFYFNELDAFLRPND